MKWLYTLKERIRAEQQLLYLECYNSVEEIIKNNNLIFDANYYGSIAKFQGKMKIIGSNKVLVEYYNLLSFIFQTQEDHNDFCSKNDPILDSTNIESHVDGNEYLNIDPEDEEQFQRLEQQYRIENFPPKR